MLLPTIYQHKGNILINCQWQYFPTFQEKNIDQFRVITDWSYSHLLYATFGNILFSQI